MKNAQCGSDGSLDLDSSKNNSKFKGCPNAKVYVRVILHDELSQGDNGEKEQFLRVPCKQWSCPHCRKLNTWTLRTRLNRGLFNILESMGLDMRQDRYCVKHFYFTLPGSDWREKVEPKEAETVLKHNLNKLLTNVRGKYKPIEYFWTTEFKNGYPHIHLIVIGPNIWPKDFYDYIKEKWEVGYEMGFTQVRQVKTLGGLVSYMTKYMTKELETGKKGSRVFSMSRKLRTESALPRIKCTVIEAGWIEDNYDGTCSYKPFYQVGDAMVDWKSYALDHCQDVLSELLAYFEDKKQGYCSSEEKSGSVRCATIDDLPGGNGADSRK